MKKIYTLIAALLILNYSFATIHNVDVISYQFSPASVNAVIGDTIKWTWQGDFHTTTSTSVPAGAATWNSDIHNTGYTFIYVVTVAGAYNYQCTVHPTLMQGTINVTGALPVVLKDFHISPGKLNEALLAWSTASEQNTDHFEIMRSADNKNFDKIATISAAGNSSIVRDYSYTDNAVPATSHYIYYFLSVVDKDGKKTYSNIQLFTNANSKTKLIVSITPNPISRSGHLMLQFNAEKEGSLHVQLYNAAGKLVKEDDLSAVVGLNNGHFHIGDVPAGVYTAIFSMDDQKESYKIVVQ